MVKDSPKELQNKVVQEFPWTGLPGEQLSTKPRISYSVRAKVSMLAELSLSNLSAKLDMITDLLVIIDSVRGNKGFVVFATTDVPHVLDPALRRPGRLDETICMPNISNTSVLSGNSRYEIFKSVNNFDSNYKSRADSLHYLQISPLIFTPFYNPPQGDRSFISFYQNFIPGGDLVQGKVGRDLAKGTKCRGEANLTINLNDSLSYCANNSNVT